MKHFLPLIFIISLNLSVKGQDHKVGVITGLNYSTYIGDFKELTGGFDRRLSYHLGVTSKFNLSDNISVSPRIMFSSQGFIDRLEVRGFDVALVKTAQRANFLNIPLLIDFEVVNNFGIQVGPQFAFFLNSIGVVLDNGGEESIEEGSKSKINGDFKLDYGARLALFYKLTDDFQVELGYYQGFSNITRNDFSDFRNDNSVFQFSVGYYIF